MLKKNLEFFNNERLKKVLEGLTIEESRWDISYCMTPTNDYLLMKNDVPIDDINDPRGAIREMLNSTIKQQMDTNDKIVAFGIGMCYLLDEVYNTYPSKIYLYEPDTKLLHFVLSNVDISEHLSSGRIYITDDMDELIKKLADEYLTKDKVEIVYLKNYAIVHSQELLELTQKVYDTCKSKMVDINTITYFSKTWIHNTLKNISYINESDKYKVSDLEGKFEGQTAMIIAAGPSLLENIEKIKANREKFVVFAVNKVLRTLISNNIIPDFVVCLDAQTMERSLTGLEEYFPRMSCISELRTDSSCYTKDFKKLFVSFSENDFVVKKIKEYNPWIKTYECGGSATTLAFVCAVKMGFEKIVFAGLDLAFKDNIMYASGDSFERISVDKIRIDYTDKTISKVKSVTGEDVYTRDDYAAFVTHFATLIKDLGYTEIYNTTSFGAAIEGMKNVPFENISMLSTSNTTSFIVGEAKPFKLETKTWTQDELLLINNVIEMLSKDEFSPALVSAIVKSPIMYQYMQADVLKVLQSKMSDGYAEEFMQNTKAAVKDIIDSLQKNKLI